MSHILRMPGVPEHSRNLLKQLLTEALVPVEALAHITESYRKVIHEAHRKNGRANTRVGDAIAHALQSLLRSVTPAAGEANLRIIQAAVRYFVIQDDGTVHDLASEDGLDDDVKVVNAVLRYLGRDDLMIRETSKSGRASGTGTGVRAYSTNAQTRRAR